MKQVIKYSSTIHPSSPHLPVTCRRESIEIVKHPYNFSSKACYPRQSGMPYLSHLLVLRPLSLAVWLTSQSSNSTSRKKASSFVAWNDFCADCWKNFAAGLVTWVTVHFSQLIVLFLFVVERISAQHQLSCCALFQLGTSTSPYFMDIFISFFIFLQRRLTIYILEIPKVSFSENQFTIKK